jgi:DNA-binding CsgD family transcriptional regulator
MPERFWRYVVKGPACWVWTGSMVAGYGQFWLEGRPRRATHVSWLLTMGELPPKGLFLCHRCDHPLCVNPAHLFLGTAKENGADAKAKGQVPRGANHYKAKLSQQQARSALYLHKAGVPQAEIAERFGVSRGTIWSLVHGRSWKHLRSGGD